MRKYPAILLAVLLLLAACSAEIVDNLPARDVEKASEVASVSAGGNSLTVSFSPVAYAKGYGYKLSGGSYTPISNPNFVDGKVVFTVSEVQDNIGDIYIYAESASDIPVEIAHSSYALSLDDVAPDVYISERGSDFVILRTSHEDRTSIIYKVQLGSNEPQYFPYVGVIRIDGLDPNQTYTATVSHSLDGESWSQKTTVVSIPTYDSSAAVSIDFHIVDDVLTASGITGDSVELYKKTEYKQEGEGTLLDTVPVSDGSASIAASELKSLESGYFYFKTGDVYSNVIKYTTPATVKKVNPNWRSAELEIDFAEDFSDEGYTITVSGAGRNSTAKVTETGLKIDGLDSNTSYEDVTIAFRNKNSLESTSSSTAIATQSFAGTYQWEGKFKGETDTIRFRIIVSDEVREGSTSPYYVYFDTTPVIGDSIINSNDSDGNSYVNQTLRIMPIVDYNVESGGDKNNTVKTDAPGDLADQNKAYLANSSKWNPMSSSPLGQVKSWYISNPDTDSERDKVVTETVSEAGMTANMQTTFEFREAEIDGRIVPVVKFKNKAIGSSAFLINNFLYQNSDSNSPETFGDTTETEGKYCWYLEKLEEV